MWPAKDEAGVSCASHPNKNCQNFGTTEYNCMRLPAVVRKMVRNACPVCTCVYVENGEGGSLSLLTKLAFQV